MNWKKFPHYLQPDEKDCGPTCIRIIAKYYGKLIPLQTLRRLSETRQEDSSLWGVGEAAEKVGFRTLGGKIDYLTLKKEVHLPCIVHWNKKHFVIVYKIKGDTVYISDPAFGLVTYNQKEFLERWIGSRATETTEEGITLFFEPTPEFTQGDWKEIPNKQSFRFLFRYLFPYKKLLFQLFFSLLAGSLLQLIFPLLTQSVVDIGIQNKDINFVYLVLAAQLILFLGQMGIEFIRSWILLHLSTRVNIALISDFFIKLMRLPIGFFDTRMTGDIMLRINDHHNVEKLMTHSALNTLFSAVSVFIFGVVLAFYNLKIFFIFFIGGVLYTVWMILFLKKRRELNYKNFSQVAQEQSKIIELINGMQEIKLQNAERQKRWRWESIQMSLFKLATKSLAIEQTQSVGSSFIHELKNILITFISVTLVMKGHLTLGMMLSVQYIIGQLNAPVLQMVSFMRSVQDAKISLERLGEIHNKDDEESFTQDKETTVLEGQDFVLKDVHFRYTGALNEVLSGINLTIASKKITAIVGASGSGKTTLLKLLMKFYEPTSGEIYLGNTPLKNVAQRTWRAHCGVVMQEGYIFNDTITGNIAVGKDDIDKKKLQKSVEIACIRDFIEGDLSVGYNTKIGNEGIGLSFGQKQCIFISRAVYKDPTHLFFDEATSSLDAHKERMIMKNLNEFFQGRTAIIIAHRLSTVKHADQIVVIDRGKIAEIGDHQSLIQKKGVYYRLVREQLNLEKINDD
ncbi:MAG: peptidase domain-containing ABC transporter [Flavobacteriales bacterium Tduv]